MCDDGPEVPVLFDSAFKAPVLFDGIPNGVIKAPAFGSFDPEAPNELSPIFGDWPEVLTEVFTPPYGLLFAGVGRAPNGKATPVGCVTALEVGRVALEASQLKPIELEEVGTGWGSMLLDELNKFRGARDAVELDVLVPGNLSWEVVGGFGLSAPVSTKPNPKGPGRKLGVLKPVLARF